MTPSDPASQSELQPHSTGLAARIFGGIGRRPVWAIAFVSLVAVILSCYPVIFCGRSYVSPACVKSMVYDGLPTLPGMRPAGEFSTHGSDTYAMMLWGVPAGFIESRSLLEHGELPLWNRYGHAGDGFIGQAVSMLGDPLQLIVILGRGSAVAWDLKFLTAKLMFCAGFGLLILRLTGNRRLSLVYAALAAYCGAFFFINNHPGFFVFCYAPWILLSALAWLDLQSERSVRWGWVWLAANVGCFNGGHVEVAVVLIGGLNLAALALALALCRTGAERARVLGRMTVATLLFLGLAAPVWMSFLGSLQGSYSEHSEVQVLQLPLRLLPGMFDDLFYQLMLPDDSYAAIAPGTSLLVFVGCALAVLRWRQLKRTPFFWINSAAIVLWAGCIFRWVPASLLADIPLLNRVGHIRTDFSYLLIIHLSIQSAYGFLCLAREENFRRTAIDFLWITLGFSGMMLEYHFGLIHRPVPWNYFLCAGAGAIGAPLLFAFLRSRPRRIPVLGWVGIIILGFIPNFRFGLYSFGDKDLLMLAGPRAVLNAPSPAIEKIQTDPSGPFRVLGLGYNFHGDYAAVYGLEDIRSCAPLSNGEYIGLLRQFPGVEFGQAWIFTVQDPVAAHPLLNLLNVKYLLAPARLDLAEGQGYRVAGRSDFLVIENPEVWPRAFFSDKVTAMSSNAEFIQALLKNGPHPFVALTAEEIAKQPGLQKLENTATATVAPATHYQLRPNSTAFDVHASSAGIVCLAEGQARDFTATANHSAREVLTVNRAFKGIYLDQPGDYHIEFTYRPRHWRLACNLFWISAGGVIVLAAAKKRGDLKNKKR